MMFMTDLLNTDSPATWLLITICYHINQITNYCFSIEATTLSKLYALRLSTSEGNWWQKPNTDGGLCSENSMVTAWFPLLTFKIIVELEWRHIPVDRHISPWRTKWDNLFAMSPGLSVLLGPNQAPWQLPVPDLKQVARVIPNSHWHSGKTGNMNYFCRNKLQLWGLYIHFMSNLA